MDSDPVARLAALLARSDHDAATLTAGDRQALAAVLDRLERAEAVCEALGRWLAESRGSPRIRDWMGVRDACLSAWSRWKAAKEEYRHGDNRDG